MSDPGPPAEGERTFRLDRPPSGSATGAEPPAAGGGGAPAFGSFGPYRLTEELGRGGQGVVYAAEDARLGRRVALKILTGAFAADPKARARFEREAAAAARLDHPSICTVYEAGVVDGAPFIAMRLVAGESLAARLRRRKAAEDAEASATRRAATSSAAGARGRRELFAELEIVEETARALHVAHEAGLVHRDVKPGNVMVEPSGRPVLLDFGLARDDGGAPDAAEATATGAFLGTPAYMSPEQTEGGARLDRRTDVWALGVVLYESIALARPFEAPTLEGLLRAIRAADPPDLRRLRPSCTPELAAVVACALEKDPARRYADAAAFADDLGRARRLEPVRARRAGPLVRARRFVERNPALVASVAAVVVALSVALVTSLRALERAESALVGERNAVAGERVARADERAARVRADDLVDFMLTDLKRRLENVGRLELLAEVARRSAEHLAALPDDPSRPGDRVRRAVALRNAGDVLKAEGDVRAAESRYADARARLEEARRADPADRRAAAELATTLHLLSAAAMSRGDPAATIALADASLALRRELAAAAPDDPDVAVLLAGGVVMAGNALRFAGRAEDALPSYREGIDRWRALVAADSRPARRRELAVALQNLGEAERLRGDVDAAKAARAEGAAIFDRLAAEDPENLEWAEQAATSRHGLALLLRSAKDLPGASAEEAVAVAALRALVARDPLHVRRRYQLGMALHCQAILHEESGRPREELAAHREAAAVRRALAATDPRNALWREEHVRSARFAARAAARVGLRSEAATWIAEAEAAAEAALADGVGDGKSLVDACMDAVDLRREFGDLLGAARSARRLASRLDVGAASRPNDDALARLADAAYVAGLGLAEAAPAEAADLFARAADATRARSEGATAVRTRVLAARAASYRIDEASAAAKAGAADRAAAAFAAAEEAYEELLDRPAKVPDFVFERIRLRVARAAAARAQGRFADAAKDLALAREDKASLPAATWASKPGVPDVEGLLAEARRGTEIAEGALPVGAADELLTSELLAARDRLSDARSRCDAALRAFPKRAVAKVPALETDLRVAGARLAARDAARLKDDRASAEATQAAWDRLGPAVAALKAAVADLDRRADEASEGGTAAVPEALREEAAKARRRLAFFRDVDPAFASLRGDRAFRAAFE